MPLTQRPTLFTSKSIKKKALAGAGWMTLSTATGVASEFFHTIVLARYLSPADFGLMAMALVIIRFGNTVSDMGISNAIIQKKDATSSQLSTLFWINALIGLVIFLLIFLFRHVICNFYNEDQLINVISFCSTIFLIFPAGQFSRSLLLKNLHFREVSLINIFSFITISSLTIYLAYLNFGVYSLVFGYLAGELIRSILLYTISAKTWSPHFTFNPHEISHFIKFGAYNTGDKIANFFNVYFIDLMIGSLLGSSALGYYALSYNIVLRPITVINTIASKVAFPILSSLQQHKQKIKSGYMKIGVHSHFVASQAAC